jgi:hypothetical protein
LEKTAVSGSLAVLKAKRFRSPFDVLEVNNLRILFNELLLKWCVRIKTYHLLIKVDHSQGGLDFVMLSREREIECMVDGMIIR